VGVRTDKQSNQSSDNSPIRLNNVAVDAEGLSDSSGKGSYRKDYFPVSNGGGRVV
jgi:hypothetical protein